MRRFVKPAAALAVLLATAQTASTQGDPGILEPFRGVWIGASVVVEGQLPGPSLTVSDISVTIRASGPGFEMSWKALRQDGAEWMTARFMPTAEPGIFAPAGAEPPLRDDETLWAEVDGTQLAVHLVSAGAGRTERVARYRRSGPDNRMTFHYTRTRNGAILDSVTGSLTRAKVVL